MIYAHLHLREWLKNHSLINITALEREASVPKGTLRHFKKERDITTKTYNSVSKILEKDYGYIRLEYYK